MPRKKLPPGVAHERRLACARKWRKANREWMSLYNARYWDAEKERLKVQRKAQRAEALAKKKAERERKKAAMSLSIFRRKRGVWVVKS